MLDKIETYAKTLLIICIHMIVTVTFINQLLIFDSLKRIENNMCMHQNNTNNNNNNI